MALLRTVLVAATASALVAGCRARRLTPEQQVRDSLSRLERAVEDKDLEAVGRFVADGFRGPDGDDRRSALGIVWVQFIRYPSIHLLLRVAAVDIDGAGAARATIFAAMAGLAMPDPTAFAGVGADLYRFDLALVDPDGDQLWQVREARWAPARPEDFVGGP